MKKIVSNILSAFFGILLGAFFIEIKKIESERKMQDRCDKYLNYYTMLNLWVKEKNQGCLISQYLIHNNYYNIAIYGMGEVGQRLCEELIDSDINILYAIDKNLEHSYLGIPVQSAQNCDPVDAIIVTATYDYEAIKKELEKSVSFPILSLNQIVFSMRNGGEI